MLEKITFFKKIFLQDEQRNASIAHAVLSEFDYVCWIDLETQGYILYYSADEKTVVPQHSAGNFDQVIGDFNLQYIVPEEAEADKALYEPRKNGKNSCGTIQRNKSFETERILKNIRESQLTEVL